MCVGGLGWSDEGFDAWFLRRECHECARAQTGQLERDAERYKKRWQWKKLKEKKKGGS